MYFFLINFFVLNNFSFSKNCLLYESPSKCLPCKYTHYEKNYVENLELSVNSNSLLYEEDCLTKAETNNFRKILIMNRERLQSCEGFYAKYNDIALALNEESESKISAKYFLLFV
jgi:hypothetical protein